MSVLTKKKMFEFLSVVAAGTAWDGMFISFMILTAALNLRWHKACKKELSVSFITSKKVPLEAEEWPCSAELTYATGLMAELCCKEAHGNVTTPEAGLEVTMNQGHQNHASNILI